MEKLFFFLVFFLLITVPNSYQEKEVDIKEREKSGYHLNETNDINYARTEKDEFDISFIDIRIPDDISPAEYVHLSREGQ